MVETSPAKSAPETAEQQLVPPQPEEIEQMKAVLGFLEQEKTVSQALDIILPYTGTAQTRQLFVGLNLCKEMLKLIANEDLPLILASSVFQILVNVAQDQSFITECIELNVGRRVFDFLMKNVK